MPTVQRRNDDLVNLLRADFQHRWEPNFAWVNATSAGLLLPQLRGFWSMASVGPSGECYDQSGQARTLTNDQVATYGIYNLWPYADFVRASSQNLYRADEAGLSSQGGMTIGGWFYCDAPSMGNEVVFMAKWLTGEGDNREYRLWKDAADLPNFSISTLGTAASVVTVTGATALTVSTWYFIWGRLETGASLDLFVNDVAASRVTLTEYNQATAAVAPFDSTANFRIGADDAGYYLDGRATLCHLAEVSATAAPVCSDVLIWSYFEQTRAGFGI
jgi:hypothetical protein